MIRRQADLDGLDAVVLPGGESTTMVRLLDLNSLFEPLRERVTAGLPTLGTCAGAILLARTISEGRADQRGLGTLDISVRRNGYGRQIASCEAEIHLGRPSWTEPPSPTGAPFPAIFIRAPIIESAGPAVEVLATHEERPVLVRSAAMIATTFHPELSADTRIHELFLSLIPGSL